MADCPFARVQRMNVSEGRTYDCHSWIDSVTSWLRRHPAVRTAFVINSSTYSFAPTPDQTGFDAAVEAYRAAFRALPPSVEQLVVIRDNPHLRSEAPTDAVARDEALKPDAAAAAAKTLAGSRVQLVDLTRFFCDAELCHPAIGGIRVYDDGQHMTRRFGHTLWSHLRVALARLSA
jgi:hypothetical protein